MLHARPVEGRFRTLRWWVSAGLIAVLFATPWLQIGGQPLVLLDIPARQFHVFGLVIFPQEFYFLWLLLAGLALSLFFFTALAGRLWCGWACPQTVFTDLFAVIARRIQGWGGYRPPAKTSAVRVVLTHIVWAALCFGIAFHLVGYFRSPWVVLSELQHGELTRTTFTLLSFATVATYLDFAIARQAFCKYLCPYARFQSVLFDRDTLVIGYDPGRGEPRGKLGIASSAASGDCVDCGLCVQVCPTDIDIRDGLQLECIACTQCIDACDGVMTRLGRATNLIGYRSLAALQGVRSGRLLRPRVAIYAGLLMVVVAVFGVSLERRKPLDMQVLRNRSVLYTTTADGRASNAFTLHIQNRSLEARQFEIGVDPSSDFELVAGINPLAVSAIDDIEASVFVLARPGFEIGAQGQEVRLTLWPVDEPGLRIERAVRFLARGSS